MTSIGTELYIHLVDNVPARTEDATLDVEVQLQQADGIFTLTKKDASRSTIYDLEVPDVTRLGALAQLDDRAAGQLLAQLVLALNASSKRAIFSQYQHAHAITRVNRDPTPPRSVSDHVSTRLGTVVVVDEKHVVYLLGRVASASGSMETRILSNFAEASATRDSTAAMRHYNAVMEMCVNLNRPTQLRGSALDGEIARISGLSASRIDTMRLVYNRTKHADENPTQRVRYEAAVLDLPNLVRDAREATTRVLQATILA